MAKRGGGGREGGEGVIPVPVALEADTIPLSHRGGGERRVVGRLVGWLAAWLVGWLLGYLTSQQHGSISHGRLLLVVLLNVPANLCISATDPRR